VRKFWDRPLGSKVILLLSAAFIVELALPWQRICAVTSGDEPRICGWRTGYEGSNWGVYAAILAGVILVWELLPVVIPKLSMRGWPAAIVTAVLATALAVCTLLKLIRDNEFQQIWAWVGFAMTLAIMVTAWLRVRYRWGIKDKPREAEPSRAVPPPQVQQPPPTGGSGA
jgi:hypothetical protein